MDETSIIAITISAITLIVLITNFIYTRRNERESEQHKIEKQINQLDNTIDNKIQAICNKYNEYINKITYDISTINSKLSCLEGRFDTFWFIIEKQSAILIKQPIHFEKDQLIDKMIDNTATGNELLQLKAILIKELDDRQKEKSTLSIAITNLLIGIDYRLDGIIKCGDIEKGKIK
jgi:hypothetical protein